MNVAYDLRYADGHFTGVGTHAYLLLRALLGLEDETRYTVLWNPKPRKPRFDIEWIARHPRVTFVERPIRTMHPLEPLQLGAWLRGVRPDVFFSPFYWIPLGAPCPCVLTIHDLWPLRLPGDLDGRRRAMLRFILEFARTATRIVTSSEFSRREIVELMRMSPERVSVARLGVLPPSAISPARPPDLPDGPFALVVGDNRPRKNLALLARVWAGFGARPPLALVGVGPANPRFPSLGALAAAAGAREVRDLGWVPEDQLAWLYANATLVLYPTIYEGFGLPLTEAFARGVPAIASDIPVLREIGEGAVRFVPPRDPAAWGREIGELLAHPDACRRLVAVGAERAAFLTYRRTAETTRGILADVVRESA